MYRKSTTYLDPGFWEPDFLCQSLPSKHVGIMRPFKFWKRDKNTHLKVMISHSVNNVEGSVRLRKTNFTYFRENISKNVCLIKNKREKGVLLSNVTGIWMQYSSSLKKVSPKIYKI